MILPSYNLLACENQLHVAILIANQKQYFLSECIFTIQ